MTCNNCRDRDQCPIRNAQIRNALMRHENNPYLDELTKVTPEELQHTNMYKKPWVFNPAHELYKPDDPEVQNDEFLYSQVAEGGVDICKKCKKAESQLNEECI